MKSEWMWDKLAANWDKPGVSLGQNNFRIIETENLSLRPVTGVFIAAQKT